MVSCTHAPPAVLLPRSKIIPEKIYIRGTSDSVPPWHALLQNNSSFIPNESKHNLPCRWLRAKLPCVFTSPYSSSGFQLKNFLVMLFAVFLNVWPIQCRCFFLTSSFTLVLPISSALVDLSYHFGPKVIRRHQLITVCRLLVVL